MDINENEVFAGTDTPENTTEILDNEVITSDDSETVVLSEDDVTSEESASTLEVSQSDIDEELMKYGALSEEELSEVTEEESEPVKKSAVQTPIIISAIAILLTAVVVFGSVLIYNAFFKPGLSGVWTLEGEQEVGQYFEFDKSGNISFSVGCQKIYGTYTMQENENGDQVMNTDFFQLVVSPYVGEEVTVSFSEDKKTMNLNISGMEIQLVKTKLPELKIDGNNITHASADELSATELNIDDKLLGSWTEAVSGTYIFEKNGTGKFIINHTHNEYLSEGSGMEYNFKYTVADGQLLVTLEYYGGTSQDIIFPCTVDGDSMLINGFAGELEYKRDK